MLTKREFKPPLPARLRGVASIESLRHDVEVLRQQNEALTNSIVQMFSWLGSPNALNITKAMIQNCTIDDTPIGASTATTGKFTTIESTIATGTAPFTVASTTKVTNLNADQVDGGDWAAPGTIGSGTANTGKFTTLEVTTSSVFPVSATTPTVTAGAGAFTSVTGAVASVKIGNRRFYTVTVAITTNGTAATYVSVPMPDAAAETTGSTGSISNNGIALSGYVTGSNLIIYKYDGTYPGADGLTLVMSGSYRV